MSFALQEVKSIARDVVREYRPGVEVIAVTRVEGGAQSAELIIAAPDAAPGSGLISIHVDRGGTDAQLRGSIADGLGRHFNRTGTGEPHQES